MNTVPYYRERHPILTPLRVALLALLGYSASAGCAHTPVRVSIASKPDDNYSGEYYGGDTKYGLKRVHIFRDESDGNRAHYECLPKPECQDIVPPDDSANIEKILGGCVDLTQCQKL